MYSFQGRLLRYDLIYVWKIFHGHCAISPEELFILRESSRTRGHLYKIHVPISNLEVRRRYFSVRVIPYWNSLSAKTVESRCLSQFKKLLHSDLGHVLFEHAC